MMLRYSELCGLLFFEEGLFDQQAGSRLFSLETIEIGLLSEAHGLPVKGLRGVHVVTVSA